MIKLSRVFLSFALTAVLLSVPVSVFAVTPSSGIMEKKTGTIETAPVASPQAMVEKKDAYLLPYPGILPDHPLYFLKGLRDRILEGLIVDPLRKAEFYVLQADKRLNMGIFLQRQGKITLMEQAISKGEKYMEKAVTGLKSVKSSGMQVPASIVDRLEKSMTKHTEVLEGLMVKADDAQKVGLSQSLELVKKLQREIEKLK